MVKDLIIKTSFSRLEDGSLKSNFGDLVRTTILLNCIDDKFLWLTDSRAINLLKWFVDPAKLIEPLHINKKTLSKIKNIYNLDNYFFNKSLNKLGGKWHGYVSTKNGDVIAENELIKAITPYGTFRNEKSWQQSLIEGMGFSWMEQDYATANLKQYPSIDVGLNWRVHPDWKSKHWPKHNWEKLEKILESKYSVSWQQVTDNFDTYINWLSSCKLVITCETLGLHLASALKKYVIAMIGPLENKEYPYGRITFVEPPHKDCMPCNSPNCYTGKWCMEDITPSYIANVIKKTLKK